MQISEVWLSDAGPFKGIHKLAIPGGTDPNRADTVVLTGPNGAGKSTFLYAVAACFGAFNSLAVRSSGPNTAASIVFRSSAGQRALLAVPAERQPDADPFGRDLRWTQVGNDGRYALYALSSTPTTGLWQTLQGTAGSASLGDWPTGFAYSGMRSLFEQRKPLTITEINDGALPMPLDFGRANNPAAFEQWVANTFTKLALAKVDGDTADVGRYERSLTLLEDAISRVVDAQFSLRVRREPLSVEGLIEGSSPTPLALLPDGLRSILSWIGDLLMRLDLRSAGRNRDILRTPFVLLLDEVEVHMHPSWQRQVLPVMEALFPNAQIFLTTHSPFVVGSATDTLIVQFEGGGIGETTGRQSGRTIGSIAQDILGVTSDYDALTENALDEFERLRLQVLDGVATLDQLEHSAARLAALGEEVAIALRFQVERTRKIVQGV